MKPPVVQKHPFGCGIACLAFVLGKKYEDAMRAIRPFRKEINGGVWCKDIVSALRTKGLNAEFYYLKPACMKRIYDDGTIVFIARSKRYPAGHYLCRTTRGWMDPWINGPPEWRLEIAMAGFRKKLPGRPIYAIFPMDLD